MAAATVRQRVVVADEQTNGQARRPFDATSSDWTYTSSPTTSETGERARVNEVKRQRLRHATPEQLVRGSEARIEVPLWLVLIVVRTVNALITSRTVFAPDEHWQSLEIAHRIVFGYGHRTWEWLDRRPLSAHVFSKAHWGDGPIRSVLYPALFVPGMWLCKALQLNDDVDVWLLTRGPSILQAFFAATTDVYTFKLARKLLNERAAWAALLSSLCSMYTFHTATRTLSNSLEACLTVIALFHWPLSLPQDSETDLISDVPLIGDAALLRSISLFALSAALRPSNVLLSVPLVAILVRQITRNIKSAATALEAAFALLVVVRTCAVVATLASVLLFTMDTLYYGRLTFTPLGFLQRNVLQSISLFYGATPVHFYLTSALPFIGFTLLPFALRGLWFAVLGAPVVSFDKLTRRWVGVRGEADPDALKALAEATLAFVAAMSVLGHKEVRFLQPIVPVLHVMQAYALVLLPPFCNPAWLRLRRRVSSNDRGSDGAGATTAQLTVRNDAQAALARQALVDRARRQELVQALTNFTSWQGRHHLLMPIERRTTWWRAPPYIFDRLRDVLRFMRVWHGPAIIWLVALNVLPIVYLSIHSVGQVRVAEDVGRLSRAGSLRSVGYLMPCHSTPWMSHMHSARLAAALTSSSPSPPLNAWFITCEPPLHLHDQAARAAYRDESDDFYDDPHAWIVEHFPTSTSTGTPPGGVGQRDWPSHLVMFEALLRERSSTVKKNNHQDDDVASLLKRNGYTVQRTYWNSVVHLDPRRRGRVILMQRNHGTIALS